MRQSTLKSASAIAKTQSVSSATKTTIRQKSFKCQVGFESRSEEVAEIISLIPIGSTTAKTRFKRHQRSYRAKPADIYQRPPSAITNTHDIRFRAVHRQH
jgi:hypothetical protein